MKTDAELRKEGIPTQLEIVMGGLEPPGLFNEDDLNYMTYDDVEISEEEFNLRKQNESRRRA